MVWSLLGVLLLFSTTGCNTEIIVISNETALLVQVNGVEIFKHDASEPMFYISETTLDITETEGNFIIKEENIKGPIGLNDITIEDNNGEYTATFTNQVDAGGSIVTFVFTDGAPINEVDISLSYHVTLTTTDSFNRVWMRTKSHQYEKIYGLGEQFTYLNLKRKKHTVWTREQGVGRNLSDPLTQLVNLGKPGAGGDYHFTYWPQSSYITDSNYLFMLDSYAYAMYNFIAPLYSEIAVQSRQFSGSIVVDTSSLMALVEKTSKIYGLQPPLPDWVYNGAILGVQGGTDLMLQYLEEAETHGVAVSAMWIQDWSGKITTEFGTRVFWNWKWNSTWYPNLDTVIQTLREEKDVRVLSYINPHLNQEGDLFREADAAGHFMRETNDISKTYVQDFGDFFCGSVDFWNEVGNAWYKNLIVENLVQFGFSGWMADFGEYTPLDCTTSDGSVQLTAEERHNLYPNLWIKLNREAIESAGGLGEILFWNRAGAAGTSGYSTMLWGGDQNVDWSFSDGLPSAIVGGLSAAMSGMGLYHFDIGGYTTFPDLDLKRTKELLLRSAEFAAFTPLMRTHEGNRPEKNHQVYSDEDTWKQFARHTQIYKALKNYTKAMVKENSELGRPVMRPLFLHYESDPGSFEEEHEYLYGSDLLVAPVLYPNVNTSEVYLPGPETWIHLWDKEEIQYNGSTTVTVDSPLGHAPVFFKASSTWAQTFRHIRDTFSLPVDDPNPSQPEPSSGFKAHSSIFLVCIAFLFGWTN